MWGEDFDDQVYCLLGGKKIFPLKINSNYMICQTPRHKAAVNISFELAFNDENYATKSGYNYTYYNDI